MNNPQQESGANSESSPFDQAEEIFNDLVEQLKEDREFKKLLEKYNDEFVAAEPTTEFTDADFDATEQAKAEEQLQRKCEYARNLSKAIIKRMSGSPNSELFITAKKLLDLLDKIESGNARKWRQLDTTTYTLIQLCHGNDAKSAEIKQKNNRAKIMITTETSKKIWEDIKSEYDISKMKFGKKINFVTDPFKRKIIFRDVEHAFVLASQGFSKPAVILAGGVIEELLKQYLEHKEICPKSNRFVDYIKTCEDKELLKRGVSRLSDSIRDFRNLVHLSKEETKQHTISKATAKGAVSSIFTIADDFQ